MKLNICAVMVVIVCLVGCTMAPEYKRPAMPIPPQWPVGEAYKDISGIQGEPAAVDMGWKDFYVDEKMQRVIHLALENNRDLLLATLNTERVRAIYNISRAELLPSINASGTWTEQRIPAHMSSETGEAMSYKQYDLNVGVVSWEIDFFGRLRSLKDRALEEYLASEQGCRSARIALISTVADTYLALAADKENLALARSTYDAQQTTYNLIKHRFDVGASSELELRQVQTRMETAKVDVYRYTARVAQAMNALQLLAGSPVPAEMLPDELNGVGPLKDLSPGISSETLLRRPDIVQAEHILKAANANLGAARAAFFPRVALTTNVGTISTELSGLFEAGSSAWLFVPRATMPIFDARLWGALKASRIEGKMALAQYEKTIQSAFREVSDALAVQGTVDEQLSSQESLVKATMETYRLAEARYLKGIDSYLTVLDAQRSLYGAKQGLVALRLSKLINQVSLYKVLGGGS